MRSNHLTLAFAYLRLSREEARNGESSSISNQRNMIETYCRQNGFTLVRCFTDDGWSGGNFDRPGFQAMMRELEYNGANTVITKDLSRLGRDMRESSYYAEQFFPENGIRYIAIGDNFDTERENIMAPFQFAMNEVYLRDGSRKVKDVLRNKRENGSYCACPPYGYRKNPTNRDQLIPDEMTAPIVQRIFKRASQGASCLTIAAELNADGVIPPLKYRVLYRDEFSEEGAAYASDTWNHTTIKRMLKNPVYLGHTLLGKSRKVSVKSKKKISVPADEWAVTENTHIPLVTLKEFEAARANLGRGTERFMAYDRIRTSIFSGIAYCELCGHAMCSCGTVYKGEREKYWFLACNHQRREFPDPCPGARIRYLDLVELVRQDLNSLITMTDEDVQRTVENALALTAEASRKQDKTLQREKANARLATIGRVIAKLYSDNAEGRLEDERLYSMVDEFQREAAGLNALLTELDAPDEADDLEANYQHFFELARQFTTIEELDRETLQTFVERIEVGPKILPEGTQKTTHRSQPFRQRVRIIYKFIGEIGLEPERSMPPTGES